MFVILHLSVLDCSIKKNKQPNGLWDLTMGSSHYFFKIYRSELICRANNGNNTC